MPTAPKACDNFCCTGRRGSATCPARKVTVGRPFSFPVSTQGAWLPQDMGEKVHQLPHCHPRAVVGNCRCHHAQARADRALWKARAGRKPVWYPHCARSGVPMEDPLGGPIGT
jgi:hypothetical protein